MSCSRTSNRAALALLLLAVGLFSCKDDLADPTRAFVELRFHADPPSLMHGAQVWLDGERWIDSLAVDAIGSTLEEGSHTIVVRKDCVQVLPADSIEIVVEGGRPQDHDFTLQAGGAVLTVVSTPPGLAVSVDGAPTGQVTPCAFPCIATGSHEVGVEPPSGIGFQIEGETARTVEVPSDGSVEAAFAFSSTPLPQSRGVMLELFTATFCPNCPPADHALDALRRDPAFEEGKMAALEVHLSWGGTDPFHTEEIAVRRVSYYYGNDPQSAPIAYFNGGDRIVGSNLPDIEEAYRQRIASIYGTEAGVGLYWSNARVEGSSLRGSLRIVAIQDISGFSQPELIAYYATDSLEAEQDPFDVGLYNGVIRDYSDAIDLKEAGVTAPGSFLDADFAFDLSIDSAPTNRPLRLGAFVQDRPSKQVLQIREAGAVRP